MIIGYIPTTEGVIEDLFGLCNHEVSFNNSTPYCEKCNSFVTKKSIADLDDLHEGIDSIGIGGGYYIAKLVNFLVRYGKLSFESTKGIKWYGLCYTIDNELISENTVTYKAKTTQTFAYSVCWFSEILFRRLSGAKYSKDEIRRIINDS